MEQTNKKATGRKGLIALIALAVAVLVLIALLVPAIVLLNRSNSRNDDFEQQLAALSEQVGKFEVSEGITAEEMQKAISDAIKGIKIPEGGLTEEQVKPIIEAAIAGIDIPSSGLTQSQVKKLIDAAIAGIDLPSSGLTQSQVKKLIADALKGIDTGLSKEEIDKLITDILHGQIKDLETGLAKGGTLSLISNVTLDEINVPKGVVSTLNLNGYTLTLSGTWEIAGDLKISNGKIVINLPEKEDDLYMKAGLNAVAGGSLNLDNVDIYGYRLWNVQNDGTLNLTNAKFYVNGGYGLSNKGTAVVKNCTLIANGEATSQIYNNGGAMNVVACELIEGTNFVSYYYAGAVESHSGGTVTLDNTKVTTGADQYSVFAGSSGKIVVNSGTISNKVFCLPGGTCVVNGGTINGVAFADITAESEIFVGVGCKLTQGENCWIISE